MTSSPLALQESFKIVMSRLVKILKDLAGMVRVGKQYTGKLETTFAYASSKRLIAVEQDLRKLFANASVQNAEQFMTSTFTPTIKLFVTSIKSAVNGDFNEVDTRMGEVRRLSVSLVQLMKESFAQSEHDALGSPQNQKDGTPVGSPISARVPPSTTTARELKKKQVLLPLKKLLFPNNNSTF